MRPEGKKQVTSDYAQQAGVSRDLGKLQSTGGHVGDCHEAADERENEDVT